MDLQLDICVSLERKHREESKALESLPDANSLIEDHSNVIRQHLEQSKAALIKMGCYQGSLEIQVSELEAQLHLVKEERDARVSQDRILNGEIISLNTSLEESQSSHARVKKEMDYMKRSYDKTIEMTKVENELLTRIANGVIDDLQEKLEFAESRCARAESKLNVQEMGLIDLNSMQVQYEADTITELIDNSTDVDGLDRTK